MPLIPIGHANIFCFRVKVADMDTGPALAERPGQIPPLGWERKTRTVDLVVIAKNDGAAQRAVLANFAGGFVLSVVTLSGSPPGSIAIIDSDMIPWSPATATSP